MKAFAEFKKKLPPFLTKEDAIKITWIEALEWAMSNSQTYGYSWPKEAIPIDIIQEELEQ